MQHVSKRAVLLRLQKHLPIPTTKTLHRILALSCQSTLYPLTTLYYRYPNPCTIPVFVVRLSLSLRPHFGLSFLSYPLHVSALILAHHYPSNDVEALLGASLGALT